MSTLSLILECTDYRYNFVLLQYIQLWKIVLLQKSVKYPLNHC